ncbi:MAG TPA: DUF3247 family protein [Rhodanobacteraceae bacterium]
MGQKAPRVCTKSEDVRQLEAWIGKLPAHMPVSVTDKAGKQYDGIVCIRPSVQSFRDRDGVEGVNGVLRLENAAADNGEYRIWLDEIADVRLRVAYAARAA